MTTSRCFLLFTLLANLVLATSTKTREETIFVFENRRVSVAVPEEFGCVKEKDGSGMVGVRLSSPKDKVSGELKFLPDPENRFAGARARKELMNEMFDEYVASSTEKAMQFEELDPQTGAGTYCVFTDANLASQEKRPSGEYLHLTTGIKAWPGVVAVFRLFSNDTSSPEYQALLKMLRESVEEKAGPLK